VKRNRPSLIRRQLTIAGAIAAIALIAAKPACARGLGKWYMALLKSNGRSLSSIPTLQEYKGEFSNIVAAAYPTLEQCERAKQSLIDQELESCRQQAPDPENCPRTVGTMFQKGLQCVSDGDPRWRGLPPEHRWFLFQGVDLTAGNCRSREQVVSDQLTSIFSFSQKKSCEDRGRDVARKVFGKLGEMGFPVPNCVYSSMYCIRGDDPQLRPRP
jgi:hypothetical protein